LKHRQRVSPVLLRLLQLLLQRRHLPSSAVLLLPLPRMTLPSVWSTSVVTVPTVASVLTA
jgi:hypothetical protein